MSILLDVGEYKFSFRLCTFRLGLRVAREKYRGCGYSCIAGGKVRHCNEGSAAVKSLPTIHTSVNALRQNSLRILLRMARSKKYGNYF